MADRSPLIVFSKSLEDRATWEKRWLSVLSLTADWSIDCGSGLSLRGPGGAAVSWVWRRSEVPNLNIYKAFKIRDVSKEGISNIITL